MASSNWEYNDNRSNCYDEYRWWVQMRRSIFIEDYLYTISSVGLSVDELVNPSNHLSSLVFGDSHRGAIRQSSTCWLESSAFPYQ